MSKRDAIAAVKRLLATMGAPTGELDGLDVIELVGGVAELIGTTVPEGQFQNWSVRQIQKFGRAM